MTRVDFYILDQQAANARESFACRIAEKAYKSGHRVYINTASRADAQRLDGLLWSFRQGSFLPHSVYPDAAQQPDTDPDPILVGYQTDPAIEVKTGIKLGADVLVNLQDCAPGNFGRYQRVVEIVEASDSGKQLGRQRFSFYRDHGSRPESHHIQT